MLSPGAKEGLRLCLLIEQVSDRMRKPSTDLGPKASLGSTEMTVLWGLGIEARSQLSLRPVRKCPGTQVRLTCGGPSVPASPVPSSLLDGEHAPKATSVLRSLSCHLVMGGCGVRLARSASHRPHRHGGVTRGCGDLHCAFSWPGLWRPQPPRRSWRKRRFSVRIPDSGGGKI